MWWVIVAPNVRRYGSFYNTKAVLHPIYAGKIEFTTKRLGSPAVPVGFGIKSFGYCRVGSSSACHLKSGNIQPWS